MKPLKRGVVLPDFKYRSLSSTKIHSVQTPRLVSISLHQHVGAPILPCVSEGDTVLVGSKIAEGEDWTSVPIHSSASGRVLRADQNVILIESDESGRMDPAIQPRANIPNDPDQLVEIIRGAGIVDLGGNALPVHHRLMMARERGIETLVLNGCESEPFLTADHVLMLEHPVEILKGAELLRLASGAKKVLIAVEKNKLEAVELLNSKNYYLKFSAIETLTLPARYPQGSERALARTVLSRRLGSRETPISAGVLVEHVATAFAVYEAVYLRKPLYERAVTVSGPCVIEPKNLWAPIGIGALDLFRACKGLMREPEQIVFGGPMTGEAVSSLNEPVTKKVQGVLALPQGFAPSGAEEPCIRCGLCVDVCPEILVPETLVRAVRKENQALAREYEIDSCTECGACSYICPSKIPIAFVIRKGKGVSLEPSAKPEPAYAFAPQG